MELQVRNAEARDLPEIKDLMDRYLSRDYCSMEELETILAGERSLLYVVTDADRDGEVVSYFYAFVAPLGEALRILHVKEKPAYLANYSEDTTVAVYKASSTKEAYRKNGVCSSFVRDLQPVVRDMGAELILATALHPSGKEEPMKHIFLSNGFVAVADLYRPWSGIHSYCPYCRQEYCICDAVFYIKKTGETEGECIRE